jgi:HlyD family secretion protein
VRLAGTTARQIESVRDSREKSRNLKPLPASRNWRGANKKFMLKWIIIVSAIVVVAAGVWHFKHGRANALSYQTTPVVNGELTQTVTATGTLNPVVNVTVGSQVSGIITKLYVDFNSPVKKDQVIAEIDPSTYGAAVEQAQANLANAKANLELQQAEAERSAELFTNKLISASDYDTAYATLHEAEATVQLDQASLDNATANLGYCKIRSPVDGVVIQRAVNVGQTVASSFATPTLFQIANDLTKMQIDSNVAEADIGGIEEGQEVTFNVDAYPYRTFRGKVTQVQNSPITVNNVVTYDCVVGVDNPDYKLKPGMTANPLNIIIAEREGVLKIPNAALRFRPAETGATTGTNAPSAQTAQNSNGGARPPGGFGGGGQGGFGGGRGGRGGAQAARTVYVFSGEGKDAVLKPVQIKIGITDGVFTEVLSGLDEGDLVVTGLAYGGAASAPSSNPFGGPRFR